MRRVTLSSMAMYLSVVFCIFLSPLAALAEEKMVNVYAWTGEIPDSIVKQFEHETNIKVNFSTYQNNEIMFTKIRTSHASYDIVMPSSYFVDRMRRLNMLEKLDKKKLPNWHNLNPEFLHPAYDPTMNYSVPFIWGVTGIFVNQQYFDPSNIKQWNDLWSKRFFNQLMLLDDTREVFSIALLALGYSPNDRNPAHIKEAFLKLKGLMKNVKVFSSETVVSIIIDEDATVGTSWNGDTYKAARENPNIKYVLPKDGFVIWVDNFAIPLNAPHRDEAYAFINFILRPDIAKAIALDTHNPIANLAGLRLLPKEVINNPVIYPPKKIMQRGQFQTDVGEETLALYEKYWEELKMSG